MEIYDTLTVELTGLYSDAHFVPHGSKTSANPAISVQAPPDAEPELPTASAECGPQPAPILIAVQTVPLVCCGTSLTARTLAAQTSAVEAAIFDRLCRRRAGMLARQM